MFDDGRPLQAEFNIRVLAWFPNAGANMAVFPWPSFSSHPQSRTGDTEASETQLPTDLLTRDVETKLLREASELATILLRHIVLWGVAIAGFGGKRKHHMGGVVFVLSKVGPGLFSLLTLALNAMTCSMSGNFSPALNAEITAFQAFRRLYMLFGLQMPLVTAFLTGSTAPNAVTFSIPIQILQIVAFLTKHCTYSISV